MARRNRIKIEPYCGPEVVQAPETTTELCAIYLEDLKQQQQVENGEVPRSWLHVRTKLDRFCEAAGHLAPSALDVHVMSHFKKMVMENFSHYYAAEHLSVVKRLVKWAAERGFVPVGVFHQVEVVAPRREHREDWRRKKIRPIEWEIVKATVRHLHTQVASMVMIQWHTGMRSAELVQMRLCDINQSHGEGCWIYTPRRHKTERFGLSRAIVIGPSAQKYINPFIEKRGAQAYFFNPVEPWLDHHRVTINSLLSAEEAGADQAVPSHAWRPPGERYTTQSYRTAIQRACDRAFPHPTFSRIPKSRLTVDELNELREHQRKHRWHPNQIRHTVATKIRHAMGIEVARTVLGHSSARTTEIYAERDIQTAVKVMKLMG